MEGKTLETLIVDWLNGGYEALYYRTSAEFQQMVPVEQFINLSKSFNDKVSSYHLKYRTSILDSFQYIWIDDKSEKAVIALVDQSDTIIAFYLKPYIIYPETDEIYTTNKYIMPVEGEWFVFWGGTNEFVNYHYTFESQRYAYDLVKVQNKLSYKDNPMLNQNFYAFDQEILAPADGIVVRIIDGFIDNVPSEMNGEYPAGNYVIIEHENKEYSMLAHLKKNSIQVEVGELVKEGQPIGRCGNSGNSSEPHLHFQIMNSPDFESGRSLRIRFKDDNEPIQGDTISNIHI